MAPKVAPQRKDAPVKRKEIPLSELRMNLAEFDGIMRTALQVKPPRRAMKRKGKKKAK